MTGDGWRNAREKAGKTLRGLADEAGVSAPFLSDIEHGRRKFSAETEAKVRHALGLGPAPAKPSSRCVVCEGPLRVATFHVYDPATGPPVYGPGSRGQYVERERITCPRCGLHYDHLPASGGAAPTEKPALGTCAGHLGPPGNTAEPHPRGPTCGCWSTAGGAGKGDGTP